MEIKQVKLNDIKRIQNDVEYYQFRNKKEMDQITRQLQERGYQLPCGDGAVITFARIKEFYNRNKIYLVRAFYNTITKRKEYVFTTHQIEKRHCERVNKLS